MSNLVLQLTGEDQCQEVGKSVMELLSLFRSRQRPGFQEQKPDVTILRPARIGKMFRSALKLTRTG